VEAEIRLVDRRIGGPGVVLEYRGREQLVMPGHPSHVVMPRDDPQPVGIVPVNRILVAQPTVIGIGVSDDVRGEHVVLNHGSHNPPSSNSRHSRESGNPGSQGSRRWPWTPAFAGVTKTRFVETRAVFLLIQ